LIERVRSAGFPVLDHLVTMTDDVGVFQHARHDIPNRSFGYCTDDVARGLIVAVEAARRRSTEAAGAKLTSTYLGFLHDAQQSDGWFHNFMGYDRRWQDTRGTDDSFGRAMWGLGYAAARAPRDSWRRVAREVFDRGLPHVAGLPHLRSRAYAALGIVTLAAAAPHELLDGHLRDAVAPIVAAYRAVATAGWAWCEPVMTYDNARLCEALIRAGSWLRDDALVQTGLEMFAFLASIVVEDGMFVPIGNDGWYPRGGERARFGQQPLEAASFVDAALAAHSVSGSARDRDLAEAAGAWFFGRNTHRALMVAGGGCRDGIDAHGASENMGAESTLAYLMSAITLAEERRNDLRLAR
jgi:hypothetical protein